jgi:DNA mismatch repair protein MutL
MPIRELPPLEAGRIAAGEVVERPASVVKELVENSLDAGASVINIEVRDGGLSLIRVVDDGCGVPADEMSLAFQRHATSKITALADLEHLATLGFRGEALASIATVAEVEMSSHTPDAPAGAFLMLRRGEVVDRGSRGAPVGTSVSVRHLFAETPARLKFLKSPRTELAQIHQTVGLLALANPGVCFRLVVEGRRSFESAGSGRLLDVLAAWHGGTLAARLIEVGSEPTGLWGFVSPPEFSRATRSDMAVFVNGRVVQPRRLAFAIEDAYAGLLPPGRHPLAAINLQVPSADLDVNVHPTKAEIKFRRDREIFGQVQKAVREAVLPYAEAPLLAGGLAPYQYPEGQDRRPEAGPFPPPLFLVGAPGLRSSQVEADMPGPARPPVDRPGRLPILRILGQMNFTFLVTEGEDGIYLVDQHRAHERVLYERLDTAGTNRQLMLDPLAVTMSPQQTAFVAGVAGELAALGFDLEPFGENCYLVRAAPALLPPEDMVGAVTSLIDELMEDGAGSAGNTATGMRERARRTVACRAAVKAGQALSQAEMRELLMDLERTESPLLCPHGDPIIVHLSRTQLERQFNRR